MVNLINTFYRDKLVAMPSIKEYIDAVQAQADTLIVDVVKALDGDQEDAIVQALRQLRRTLEDQNSGEARNSEVEAAQAQVVNLINTFYRDKLVAMPSIKEYIDACLLYTSRCV